MGIAIDDASSAVFVIGQGGAVTGIEPDSGAIAEVGRLTVFSAQESGLLGIALDPEFSANQWMYLHYAPMDYVGGRVSRFTLVNGLLEMESEKILLEYGEQRDNCCHHAGSMAFDGQGNLFVATGDNTYPAASGGFAPVDERPERSVYDAQKSAGNTNDLRGKILRIRPTPDGSYAIPEGNLFPTASGIEGRPEIFVMGCRNPWRISVDKMSNTLFWGEVGPDAGKNTGNRGPRGYDEINRTTEAGNFGWPYFIANNQPYKRFNFATNKSGPAYELTRPSNTSPNNTGSELLPPPTSAWIYYPYGGSPEFPQIPGPRNRTACAGPVVHFDAERYSAAAGLPEYYDDAFIFYDWSRNWLMTAKAGADGKPTGLGRFLGHLQLKRPIDVKLSTGGALYVLEYGSNWGINADSRLSRINYYPDNRPPVAVAKALSPVVGGVPLVVRMSAAGSSDLDGDSLRYNWHQVGSSEQPKEGEVAEFTITESGRHRLCLTVTDSRGTSQRAWQTVLVGNAVPKVRITAASEDRAAKARLSVRVDVEDREDAALLKQVQVVYTRIKSPQGKPAVHAGQAAIRQSDCLNCHAASQKVVGPAFIEIADRYRTDGAGKKQAIENVLKGSSGVWGDIPMLPHPQLSRNQATTMVNWIMTLMRNDQQQFIAPGGTVEIPMEESSETETIAVSATYTDRPIPPVGAHTVQTARYFRPARFEAEACSGLANARMLPHEAASAGTFLGSVNRGARMRYPDFRPVFTDRCEIRIRAASATSGGTVTFRSDTWDGPVLASIAVTPTGDWQKWVELSAIAKDMPESPFDLCVSVTGPRPTALMNIDWIEVGDAAEPQGPTDRFIRRLERGDSLRIVTMGTSLTGGTWRWVDVMAEWLNADYPKQVTIINRGVGASASQTVASMNPRYVKGKCGLDLIPRVIADKPDVVFIEFAVNDAHLPYGINVAQCRSNLETIIDRLQAAHPAVEIILQTMNAIHNVPGHAAKPQTNRPQLNAYNQAYRDVAAERKLLLIDHHPNWQRLLQDDATTFIKYVPDGIHPQLPGYRAILLPELKKALRGP